MSSGQVERTRAGRLALELDKTNYYSRKPESSGSLSLSPHRVRLLVEVEAQGVREKVVLTDSGA